jgi:hypothetical protein
MTKQQFDRFLEEKERNAEPQKIIDWDARKQEWLESLKSFYELTEGWLTDYIKTGKIQIESSEVQIEEEYLGRYAAASRVLKIGSDKVVLRPIGTSLIGARGRVDMDGPKGSVKFILTGKGSDGIRISISVISADAKADSSTDKRQPERVNVEWVWKIATTPPSVRFIELTADTFFDALTEVLNG